MRNGTILMLHIIPNRKLHTISFQMAYDVAVSTVGTLKTPQITCFFFSLAAPLLGYKDFMMQ